MPVLKLPIRSKGGRQRLYRGHISLGILCSLLMYVSVYFGLFAIFLPYIQVWEKPSRHFGTADITKIDYAPMIDSVLSDPDFPRDQVLILLPGVNQDPSLRIFHPFTKTTLFNPATLRELKSEGKTSNLANFLNGMHYGRPLKKLGRIIFGFMTLGVMFLTIGGLILILIFPYKDPARTRRGLFSKWHRKIFARVFPVFLWIVMCGSVMCLSTDGIGPMTYIATRGEHADIRPVVGPVLFPVHPPVKQLNQPASMRPIGDLIVKARQINPQVDFQKLTLINWGDKSARIRMEGYNPARPFLNGVTNKPFVTLSAVDGRLIRQTRVLDRPWSVLLTDSVYFLHLLFSVGIVTRLLVFSLMLASCFGLGFGVMVWLEKKAVKFEDSIPFYHWMGKLSLAVMVGVIPATGVLLNLQWLLPFDMPHRLVWQQGAFFNAWLATLAWSFYRINSHTAAREFLALGGALFLSAPVLHWIKTGFGPVELIRHQMPQILGVDIGLSLVGIILLLAACKLPENNGPGR